MHPVGRIRAERATAYRHEAALWRGADGFLDVSVPFVTEGVECGEPVMVATLPERIELLRQVLEPGVADKVRFVDMAALGGNPACIIPAWTQFIGSVPQGRRMRGIGEPIWPGRSVAELAECQLHEHLLNVAVEPSTPMWLRCPYDAESLPSSVLEEVQRSHPLLVGAAVSGAPVAYAGPDGGGDRFAADLMPAPSWAPVTRFGAGDMRALRERVADEAGAAGVRQEQADDLVLAVHELAANSVRHGGGGGQLRVWREPGALICEIRDTGHVEDPLAGRRSASEDEPTGRGLWMVNQLCDLVQLRSTAEGTTVRIHTWL
jgi:anti-sigma regulatory factor (Ser/Thr protein kinase)